MPGDRPKRDRKVPVRFMHGDDHVTMAARKKKSREKVDKRVFREKDAARKRAEREKKKKKNNE